MSGRVTLVEALKRQSASDARRHQSARRGNITSITPLTVEAHGYKHPLVADADFALSQWARLYHAKVGIQLGDTAIMQFDGQWILMDVVSTSSLGAFG